MSAPRTANANATRCVVRDSTKRSQDARSVLPRRSPMDAQSNCPGVEAKPCRVSGVHGTVTMAPRLGNSPDANVASRGGPIVPAAGPGPGATLHRPCVPPSSCTCLPSSSGPPSSQRIRTRAIPTPTTTSMLRARLRRVTGSTSTSCGSSPRSAAPSRPIRPCRSRPSATGCRSRRWSRFRSSPCSARSPGRRRHPSS